MARSLYIYLVHQHGGSGGSQFIAAFTVKRELLAWLKREADFDDHLFARLNVFRMKDGGGAVSVLLGSASEVLDGG